MTDPVAIIRRPVDVRRALNRTHPLAQGLRYWLMAVPPITGSVRWFNLAYPAHATITDTTNTKWKGTTRPGGLGKVRFDSGARMSLPVTYLPVGGTRRTIMFWMKPDAVNTGTSQQIIRYGTSGTSYALIDIRIASGTSVVSVLLQTYTRVSTTTLVAGQWAHVAITTGANGSDIKIYVNGQLGGATSTGTDGAINTVSSGSAAIGTTTINASSSVNPYIGDMDDLRVYSRAFTDAEVYAAYLNSVQGCPGLLRRRPRARMQHLREQEKRCAESFDGGVSAVLNTAGESLYTSDFLINSLIADAIADAESVLPITGDFSSLACPVRTLTGNTDSHGSDWFGYASVSITPIGVTADSRCSPDTVSAEMTVNVALNTSVPTDLDISEIIDNLNSGNFGSDAAAVAAAKSAIQGAGSYPYAPLIAANTWEIQTSSPTQRFRIQRVNGGDGLTVWASLYASGAVNADGFQSGAYNCVYQSDNDLERFLGVDLTYTASGTNSRWPEPVRVTRPIGTEEGVSQSLPFTGAGNVYSLGDSTYLDGSGSYTDDLTSCYFVGDPITITMPVIAPDTVVTLPNIVRTVAVGIISPDTVVTPPAVVLGVATVTVPVITPLTVVTPPAKVLGAISVTPGLIETAAVTVVAPDVRLLMRRTPAIIAPDVTVTAPGRIFGTLTKTPPLIAPDTTVTAPTVRLGNRTSTVPVIAVSGVTVSTPDIITAVSIPVPVIAPQTVVTPPVFVAGSALFVTVPTITTETALVLAPDVLLSRTIEPDVIAPATLVDAPSVVLTFPVETIAPQTAVTAPDVTLGPLTVVPETISCPVETTPPDAVLSLSLTPDIIAPTVAVTSPTVSLSGGIPVEPIITGPAVVIPPDVVFSGVSFEMPIIAPQTSVLAVGLQSLKTLAASIIVAGTAVVFPPDVVLARTIEVPTIQAAPVVTPPDVLCGPLTVPVTVIQTDPVVVIPPTMTGELTVQIGEVISPDTEVIPPDVRTSFHAVRVWHVPVEGETYNETRNLVWTVPIRGFRWTVLENQKMASEVLSKQPGESIVFAFDFTELLETIDEELATVTSVTATPSGLTLTDEEVNSQKNGVNVRIAGGTTSQMYKVTAVVTTSGGNTLEADGKLYCRNA